MKQVNRTSISEILSNININPTKDRGQNFLIDPLISEKIVNLPKITAKSKVIEVGPGLGSLSYYLEKATNNLTLIDIDDKVISYLKNEINNATKLIHQDALKYDFSSYDIVLSNIPYNITKDLIVHLLISAKNSKQFIFMCQKENFSHFYDVSGSEYGPSSILVHLLGSIKKAFDVKPPSFYPSPKCVSTVFVIDRNNDYDFSLVVETYRLANKLFLNRRKTILNNLSNAINKQSAIKVLESLNIDAILRPEDISPDKFYELTKTIKEMGC